MTSEQPSELDPTDESLVTADCRGIPFVPGPSQRQLKQRQQVDYATFRKQWLRWCLAVGKNPQTGAGYANSTVRTRANIMDQFARWVWDKHGGYTTQFTHDHADDYLRQLAFEDHGQEHKLNVLKSLKMLFSWIQHQRGGDEWEPEMEFSQPPRRDVTGDSFDNVERRQLREAALEYGSIPHYSAVSPDERYEWNVYLSQRFDMPLNEVGPDQWERANGWKYPSIVWASIDAALRPIEVERAKLSWLDLSRQRLVIPKNDDVKTESADHARKWTVALTERTTEALRRWVEQREQYPKYDNTDALWRTRFGNPYGSSSLKKLVEKLCDIADIDTTHRNVSWYSIRRGTVTAIVEESDLSTAAEQVRHVDIRSTARYDQVSDDRRRDVLERIG